MYADTGIMFPFFRNFSQEVEELEQLCYSQKPTFSLDRNIPTSTISDYDLGVEAHLFRAPELMIKEQMAGLDPMAGIEEVSLISPGDEIMPSSVLKAGDVESLQHEPLWSMMTEFSEKTLSETSVSDVPVMNPQPMMRIEGEIEDSKWVCDSEFTKCGSSGSLSSMEWVSGDRMRPNFLDFRQLDFGSAAGMRRAFSEGDIKALGNGSISLTHSPLQQQPLLIGNFTSRDRLQKLSRYRDKRSRRNFGRKIKYACRKALADNQPRIRGRFAKTEDADSCKKQ